MLIYASLAGCTLLAGLLVYRYDLYEREPWYMLVLMTVAGGVAMWAVGFAEGFTIDRFDVSSLAGISLVAATHEEAVRLLLVILLALLIPSQFNDPLDGLIYGSVIGLGMAVAESIGHLADVTRHPSTLPTSELVRLLGHLVLGGITCAGVGFARLRLPRWPLILMGGVLFATAWHFLWDWTAFTASAAGQIGEWHNVAAVGLMLSGLVVYGAFVIAGSRRSRERFAPGDPRELWGWPFTIWRK